MITTENITETKHQSHHTSPHCSITAAHLALQMVNENTDATEALKPSFRPLGKFEIPMVIEEQYPGLAEKILSNVEVLEIEPDPVAQVVRFLAESPDEFEQVTDLGQQFYDYELAYRRDADGVEYYGFSRKI